MLVADPTPVSAVTTLDDLTETANTAQLVSFSDFFYFSSLFACSSHETANSDTASCLIFIIKEIVLLQSSFSATRELSDWIFCSKNSKHGGGFREGGGHLTPQLDQWANLSSGVGLSLTSWGVAPSST